MEQLDAVMGFQVADLGGHRRLAQAKLLGRLGDAAQPGDHVKRLELLAEHGWSGSGKTTTGRDEAHTLAA